MKRFLPIIILCLFIGNPLEAAERSVKVRPVKEEFFVTKPRNIVTTSFRVTNQTNMQRECIPELELPEGWTQITEDFPFDLAPKQGDIRLVSFFVPQTALAGQYPVVYSVRDSEIPSLRGHYTIFVSVLPLIKIRAELLEAPEYIIAGDHYPLRFLITNESNIETTIGIRVKTTEDYPFTLDLNKFQLTPGASQEIHLTMETDQGIEKGLKQVIHLFAEVIEDEQLKQLSEAANKTTGDVYHEKIEAHAIATVDIVPRISFVESRYHEIPGEISFRWATEKDADRKSGFQTKISGKGPLDEEGKRDLEFLFKVSDNEYDEIYSSYDEYFLGYKTASHEILLGDRAYRLSPLTENYLYGRGIQGTQAFDRFRIKAYHMKTRRFRPDETQTAGHLQYMIRDTHPIGLNYLTKKRGTAKEDIISLDGTFKPSPDINVEVEYANSSENDACLLNLSGYQNRVSYYLKYIHADPNYPGYYTDMDFVSANLGFSLTRRLELKTYFRQEKNNLLLDPQRGSSFLDKFYGLGLDYHFKTGTHLSFDWRLQIRLDRLPSPTTDYQEDNFRFGIGQNLDRFNLYSSIEFSHVNDKLANTTFDSENYRLNAYFRATDKLNCKGYLYWKSHGSVTGETNKNLTTGFGIDYRVLERTFFNLNMQSDHYRDSEQNQNIFETKLNHRFENHHDLSAFARHLSFKDPLRQDETIFMLTYSLPFGLPVRRKKGIGSIKGSIYDFETKEPISNVILRLNGLSGVTDKRGRFFFPAVHPGTFYLSVDRTEIDPNKIAIQKIPIEVHVEGGKDTFIEIPIGRKAALSGRILLYQTENGGFMFDANQKIVESRGLKNMIVEMTKGSDVNRRITDQDGYFEFEELQPGGWNLKVYHNSLPEYYTFENDQYRFELQPGETQSIVIRVLPRIRHIHMIEEGGLLTEEEPK